MAIVGSFILGYVGAILIIIAGVGGTTCGKIVVIGTINKFRLPLYKKECAKNRYKQQLIEQHRYMDAFLHKAKLA